MASSTPKGGNKPSKNKMDGYAILLSHSAWRNMDCNPIIASKMYVQEKSSTKV